MRTLNASQLRKSLAREVDRVIDDHEPTIITRDANRAAVLIAQEDYNSLLETAYLFGNPHNAKRIAAALQSVAKGDVSAVDLDTLV